MRTLSMNNYFSGEGGLRNYAKPAFEKMIPLVELPSSLNPFLKKYGIHINAKLMNTLPLMNVKSLPAWKMLEDADLNQVDSAVESSSGNTVASIGLYKDFFGIDRVKAIVSNDVTKDKLAFLRVAGLDIEFVESPICPDPRDPDGPINIAKRQGENDRWLNLGQYDNPSNPKAHQEITGPQIEAQLGGKVDFFSAGLGTTGTFTGTAQYLKSKIPSLITVGAVRVPNNAVPGVRTINQLAEIDFKWDELIDKGDIFKISTKESYCHSLMMIRKGLLVGPSAGFSLAALIKKLEKLEKTGEIENYRGAQAVFICPDSPLLYIQDYEEVLGSEYFGEMINMPEAQAEPDGDYIIEEITPEQLLASINGGDE